MIKMKLALVFPPLKEGYKPSRRSCIVQNRSLPQLATFVKNNNLAEVSVYDGIIGTPSKEYITREISTQQPEIVGFNTNIVNYPVALEMAEALKQGYAPVIVFGGPWMNSRGIAVQTLFNRSFVDYACIGQGEPVIEGLLGQEPVHSVPNLIWKDGTKIIRNESMHMSLDEETTPDMSFLNIEEYIEQAKEQGLRPSLTLKAFSGCSGQCYFCGREYQKLEQKSVEKYVNEMEKLSEQFGVTHFWDVSATFTWNLYWLKEFAEAMEGRGFTFSVYSRANEITPEKASLLKRAGVIEVFIGYESGDDQILESIKKGLTRKQAEYATQTLADHSVGILGAFMVGNIGENNASAQRTLDLAYRVHKIAHGSMIYSSLLVPLPALEDCLRETCYDALVKKLVENGAHDEIKKITGDIIDPNDLRESWFRDKRFCELSLEEAIEWADRIAGISNIRSSFISYHSKR